jgi:Ca2+-binding RTX toxin-like protein
MNGLLPDHVDPLLIDLNRDGKTDTSGARFFDMNTNGRLELISWVSSDDGLLVIDKNNNGLIDDGQEVFGNSYVKSDGTVAEGSFEALSDIDSNGDGIINADDDNFADLLVWADLNDDGIFADDELVSLENVGIESISLSTTNSGEVDENGNTVVEEGQIAWSDGETGIINAYEFWNSDRITLDPEGTEIPEEIQDLPNLLGRGLLTSLHLAMTIDESGELKELVEDFCSEGDSAARLAILDEILYAWANASDIAPASRGGNFDARKLAFLEKYRGSNFVGANGTSNPNAQAAPLLNDSYGYAKAAIYGELLAVSIFKDAIADSLIIDEEAEIVSLNIDGVLEDIYEVWSQNAAAGITRIKEFMMALEACKLRDLLSSDDINSIYYGLAADNTDFADAFLGAVTVNLSESSKNYSLELWGYGADDTITGGNADDYITGGDGADHLYGGAGSDIIFGDEGADHIEGGTGDDILVGGSGDDTIKGDNGSDIFIGGAGDDYLQGNDGHDVYVWNLGDGNDTINDDSYNKRYYGDTGILKIGDGVDPNNIENTRVGNNLVLIIGESGERLTVQNWYSATYYQLTRIEFADGTIWTAADINAKSVVLRGTDEGETIQGFSAGDKIYGHGGDDLLVGNDGHDIYVWSLGDGNDTIDDYSYNKHYYGETGVLNIGAEVDPTLIELTRSSNDLVCTFDQTGESITVQNWYSADYYQLTSMNFANGTTWSRANINAIASGTLSPFSTNS